MSLAAFRGLAGAMFAFAMVAGLGILMRPLLPIDETRYLAVAWEMRQSGNWIVPHLNGALYAQKPPLLFWLIDLEWALFGVSETGARLVGPLAGVAGLFLTGRLAGRLWPDDPALSGRAAWMLAGFSTWALYAGLTMFDALLGVAVLVGMSALVADRDGRFGWIGLGAALAFGVLAKGPVILVYLLPAALAMPFLRPERWTVSLRRIGLGLLLALGLVGLWLVPALVLGGAEYREAVLWTQSAGRVANAFDHARPFWFFAALLPLLLWPWLWSRQVWQGLIFARWRDDFGLGLAAVWALGTLGLFSLIASKQLHYMVPAFPAVALILARATPVDALRAPAAALLPAVLGFGLIALGLGWQPDARSRGRCRSAVGALGERAVAARRCRCCAATARRRSRGADGARAGCRHQSGVPARDAGPGLFLRADGRGDCTLRCGRHRSGRRALCRSVQLRCAADPSSDRTGRSRCCAGLAGRGSGTGCALPDGPCLPGGCARKDHFLAWQRLRALEELRSRLPR